MKKLIIILAVILTSALTALSLNRKDNKSEEVKTTIEKSNVVSPGAATANLATAD